MNGNLRTFIQRLRDGAVPLAAISTADQPATARAVAEIYGDAIGVVLWTCLDGFVALNEPGRNAVAQALGGVDPAVAANPVEGFSKAKNLPAGSVIVFQNAHRFTDNEIVMQALMDLRDLFKGTDPARTAILTGPSLSLPVEVKADFLSFSVGLPDRDEIKRIAFSLLDGGGFTKASKDAALLDRLADATTGLPPFGVEQAFATNLTPKGPNLPGVWTTKLGGLPAGLSGRVFDGPVKAAGYTPFRESIARRFRGPNRPRAIVVLSEVDKTMAGSTGGDLSGVKAGILGDFLVYLDGPKSGQPKQGMMLFGLPGTGKDYAAMVAASEHQIPYLFWDPNSNQDSLVGSTGKNVRAVLDAIDSVSGGNPLFLVSCNRTNSLPPELQRRFGSSGRWMFDVPTTETRAGIWEIQLAAYGLDAKQERPADAGWTGAEIRNCCKIAWEEGLSLVDAGRLIVPVTVSNKDDFDALRTGAVGKFLDAQRPGLYMGPIAETTSTVRKLGVVAEVQAQSSGLAGKRGAK